MHENGMWESDEEHANPINASGRTAEEQEEHINETQRYYLTLSLDEVERLVTRLLRSQRRYA
jgi:hypothetical protein